MLRSANGVRGHLFLLYVDTRVGIGDRGPYDLPDGRTLLVRDYHRAGTSDFPWSDVAVCDFLSLIEGDNAAPDPDEEWYSPVAV